MKDRLKGNYINKINMPRQKKFIIVKDWDEHYDIRFGYVLYHKDLMYESDKKDHIECIGGGKWEFDYDNKTITLYGSSDDFGRPQKKDIQKALNGMNKKLVFGHLSWTLDFMYEDEFPDRDYSDLDKYTIILNYE